MESPESPDERLDLQKRAQGLTAPYVTEAIRRLKAASSTFTEEDVTREALAAMPEHDLRELGRLSLELEIMRLLAAHAL